MGVGRAAIRRVIIGVEAIINAVAHQVVVAGVAHARGSHDPDGAAVGVLLPGLGETVAAVVERAREAIHAEHDRRPDPVRQRVDIAYVIGRVAPSGLATVVTVLDKRHAPVDGRCDVRSRLRCAGPQVYDPGGNGVGIRVGAPSNLVYLLTVRVPRLAGIVLPGHRRERPVVRAQRRVPGKSHIIHQKVVDGHPGFHEETVSDTVVVVVVLEISGCEDVIVPAPHVRRAVVGQDLVHHRRGLRLGVHGKPAEVQVGRVVLGPVHARVRMVRRPMVGGPVIGVPHDVIAGDIRLVADEEDICRRGRPRVIGVLDVVLHVDMRRTDL